MAQIDGYSVFHARWPYANNRTITHWYGASVTIMTSEERREARYIRRRSIRESKRIEKYSQNDSYESVFSYANLYDSYRKCRRGVSWKASVQKYIATAPLNIAQTHRRLMNGTYKSPGFYEFDLYERGKKRHIRSTVIGERVVQRCLCDNSIVPLVGRTFIHDNGASLKDKGYDFAIRRIKQHLREYCRKNGSDGYILLFDFRKFFDNVSHDVVKTEVRKNTTDERLVKLIDHFIDIFGNVGLGLGSQISQILALASANRLDHFIKENLRIREYGRYMDDGYIIHRSKEYLKHCLSLIKELCKKLGIVINEKKTQIVKLSHGFSWLKSRIFITESGRVVTKIYKRSITKMRQKLKKIKKLYLDGKLTMLDVYNSWQSWKSYALRFNAWNTIQSMGQLYNRLFVFKEA